LHSLYSNYEKIFRRWEQNEDARARSITPPVFIVVCNNTNVSKLVFDYIAGWEKSIGENMSRPGLHLPNDDGAAPVHGRTMLVDSQQLSRRSDE
jgi:type III restriction enzyme